MKEICKTFLFLMLFFGILSAASFLNAQDSLSFSGLNPETPEARTNKINAELDQAYQNLARNVSYEIKMKSVATLEKHYRNPRAASMAIALLGHNYGYNNPGFTESRQNMYQDNVIVEKLVVILGKNGNPACFPILLSIVVNPARHREETVNAAWKAMQILRYDEMRSEGN